MPPLALPAAGDLYLRMAAAVVLQRREGVRRCCRQTGACARMGRRRLTAVAKQAADAALGTIGGDQRPVIASRSGQVECAKGAAVRW
jgi:hypothetical protein